MSLIKQDNNKALQQVKKTVDWLVNNTSVNVFDPIKFEGYQRQIDNTHCDKIIKYLEKEFFLPSSIICATDNYYDDNVSLRIVDGQHRVEAFRRLSSSNHDRYEIIKNYELSIIVMVNVSIDKEIDAFITINKTSKKVDTSLAYVLKNKLKHGAQHGDSALSKREYLSVELAQVINKADGLWNDKIKWDGNPKNTSQLISLSTFVNATRGLLTALEKSNLINFNWKNEEDIKDNLDKTVKIIGLFWKQVSYKWSDLFTDDIEKRRIIQGAIGYTSLNRALTEKINGKEERYRDLKELENDIIKWVNTIEIDSRKWLVGGYYSKFSSGSGHNMVAKDLFENMRL